MDIGLMLTIIWPYLAALYLLDCVLLVRGGHLFFTCTPPSGFRFRGPGLRVAGLLPWDWSVLISKEPLIMSEGGIYTRIDPNPDPFRPPHPDDYDMTPWEETGNVRNDGKRVILGGKQAFLASTGIEAANCCRRILRLRNLPVPERSRALRDDLAAANDLDSIQEMFERIKRPASLLTGFGGVLFFWTLFLLPVSLLIRVPAPVLWAEVLVFLAGWLSVMALWWRSHKYLFPEAVGDRLEEMFVFLFFPVSALHPFGKLTRRLFAAFDSVALIVALAPSRAGEILEKEHIRATAAASSHGSEDFTLMWKMRVRTLEELAGRARVNLTGEGLLPKSPASGEVACALCGALYREGIKECADCGIALVR